MRKKRKARGRAERAALAAVAVEAGVEVGLDEQELETAEDSSAGSGEDAAPTGDAEGGVGAAETPVTAERDADAMGDAEADGEAMADGDAMADGGAMADAEGAAMADAAGEPDAAAEADAETDAESAVATDAASSLSADADGATDPASELSDGETDPDSEDIDELEPEAEAEGTARPQAAHLDEASFTSLIEALLFAADKPLTVARLRQLTRVSDRGRIAAALERIGAAHAETGIVLSSISGGYSFRTNSRFSTWVQQLIQGRPVRLSRAQLETLAIVAYRQPITRPEIDQIRGVDSGATLKLLLDRSLVRILGKREEVGRPILYGTTREFLDFFSLNDLRELPTLREFSELTEESRGVVEKLGLDAPPAAVAAAIADLPPDAPDAPAPDAAAAAGDAAAPDAEVAADLAADSEPESISESEPASASDAESDPLSASDAESDPLSESDAEPASELSDDLESESLSDQAEDPAPNAPSEAEGRVEGPPPIPSEPSDSSDTTVLDSPEADSFDTSGDGTLS